MKRPFGVTLSAIFLGLCAGFQLLMAVAAIFGALAIRHFSTSPMLTTPPGYPAPVLPSSGFLTAIIVGEGVFFLLLAAWAVATLIGLLRLRNWARYSVLVIGGCMAILGLISILGIVVVAVMLPGLPGMPPNLPPHTMQLAFGFEALIFALVATLGMWWLVYFNLRATKRFFVPTQTAVPTAPDSTGYAIDPQTFPDLPPRIPVPPPPVPPGSRNGAPTAIIVLACFFALGGLSCLPMAFLTLPGFFVGFIFRGFGVHLLYLCFAVISLLIAWGLFRLDNRARLGAYALMLFGAFNFILLLTPWGSRQYSLYMAQVYGTMNYPSIPGFDPAIFSRLMMYFVVPFCFLIDGVQIWILERHRAAFLRSAPGPN